MKPENLSQVVAIVTGAAGGLGSVMTGALVEGGARVLAADVDRGALDALAGRLPDGRVAVHAADIRDAEACAGIVARAVSEFGAVHALVNNAGIGQSSIRPSYYVDRVRFWEVTDERWRTIVETNAMAPFMLAKAVLPHMTEAGWGRIVNVTTSLDTMTRPRLDALRAVQGGARGEHGDLGRRPRRHRGDGQRADPGRARQHGDGAAGFLARPGGHDPARVMAAPIRWLLDRASDGVTGRRFLGVRWDPSLPPEEAAERHRRPPPGRGSDNRLDGPDKIRVSEPSVTARDIRIGIVLMLCGTALFGCGESVVKLLTRHYDTMQIVWGRYVFHAIVFLAIFARTGIVAQMRTARPWLQFSRSAILLTGTLLFFGALRYLALADAVAINFFAPLLVTAFSIPMLKEQVGIRRWIAILVGFAGVMVIIRPGLGVMHWAAILPLGTAVCYALYQVLTRMAGRTDHARTSLFWSAAVGTVVMSLIVPFGWTDAGRAGLGR